MDTEITTALPTETLGARLRAAREAAGLTQKQVAIYIDCDHTTISKIEGDHFDPSIDLFRKLTLVYLSRLPIDFNFLLYGLPPLQVRQLAYESYGS